MSNDIPTRENNDGHPTGDVSSSSIVEIKLQRTKFLRKKLAETLGYSSIALQLAVAYIKSANDSGDKTFGIGDYLKIYEKKMKGTYDDMPYCHDDVEITTLMVTLDAMAKRKGGKGAMKICHLLAYVAPDKPIPLHLLDRLELGNSRAEHCNIQDAVRMVGNFAICIIDEDERTVRIDKVVQQLIRKDTVNIPRYQALRMGLRLLEELKLDENLIKHALSVWHYGSKHPDLISEHHEIVIEILLVPFSTDCETIRKFANEQKELLSKNVSADNETLMKLEDALLVDMNYSDRQYLGLFVEVLRRGPFCKISDRRVIARFKRAIELSNNGRVREAHDLFKIVQDACVSEGSGASKTTILTVEGHMIIWKYELGELSARDCAEKLKPIIKDIGKSTGGEDDFTPYLKARAAMVLFECGEQDLSAKLFMEIRKVENHYRGRDSSLLKLTI